MKAEGEETHSNAFRGRQPSGGDGGLRDGIHVKDRGQHRSGSAETDPLRRRGFTPNTFPERPEQMSGFNVGEGTHDPLHITIRAGAGKAVSRAENDAGKPRDPSGGWGPARKG